MPRVSKEVREIAEKNERTMKKAPIFEYWVHVFLKDRSRLELYRKAYELVNKPEEAEDDQADS